MKKEEKKKKEEEEKTKREEELKKQDCLVYRNIACPSPSLGLWSRYSNLQFRSWSAALIGPARGLAPACGDDAFHSALPTRDSLTRLRKDLSTHLIGFRKLVSQKIGSSAELGEMQGPAAYQSDHPPFIKVVRTRAVLITHACTQFRWCHCVWCELCLSFNALCYI
jgi:hypothetical protein